MKPCCLSPLLSLALLVATPSFAQETRAELVQQIAKAQGLQEMFEQQLATQRDGLKSYANKLFDQAVAESGGKGSQKQRAVFARFVENASSLFTSEEITAAWIASYGKELSDQDLKDVLRYYQSPTGKKDVAASKAAMASYSEWITQESQTRATAILKTLVQELQAAKP